MDTPPNSARVDYPKKKWISTCSYIVVHERSFEQVGQLELGDDVKGLVFKRVQNMAGKLLGIVAFIWQDEIDLYVSN
jgi:hypothetical protein